MAVAKKKKGANSARVFEWVCQQCKTDLSKVGAEAAYTPVQGKCEECDEKTELHPVHIDDATSITAPATA